MKNTPWISRIVTLLAVFSVMAPTAVLAAEFRSGDQVGIASTETLVDDLYAAGGMVSSAGNIMGDLFLGGGSVLISGPVSADAFVAGGNISITGDIADDLRVAGGNIVVQSTIGGDAFIGGGQVQLGGALIGGDLLIGGGMVRIDTAVGGDVKVGGGQVYLNAPVAGNVEIVAEKIVLGSKAAISGNLVYRSKNDLVIEEGAVVTGTTSREPFPMQEKKKVLMAASLAGGIFYLLMRLVGAMFLGLFFNRYATSLTRSALARPLEDIGRGFIAIIVLPVTAVLLLITVIGVPLGVLTILCATVAMLTSVLIAPILLGAIAYRWIAKDADYAVNWKTILLGVVIYALLCFIPVVGWLLQCALVVLVFGAQVRMVWDIVKEWR